MDDTGTSIIHSFLKKHKRYLMVFIYSVEFFVASGPLFSYSILFVGFHEEFDAGATLTGWVGSVANTVLGCGSPVSASLIRRFGPRVVTLVGAILLSTGLAATSFVPALGYAYLTFGFLVGFGANFIYQAEITVIMEWFPGKSCSRGIGLALLGSSFSLLAFAPFLNWLMSAFSWRNALRIISVGSLVISLVHGAFIITPKKEREEQDRTAQNIVNEDTLHHMTESNTVDKDEDGQPQRDTQTSWQKVTKLVRNADIWMWFFANILLTLGLSFIIINFASFMEYDLHFTSDQVSIAFVLFAVGEITGKILLSMFADSLPFMHLYVVAAACLLSGGTSGLMNVLRTPPLMFSIAVFMGLFRAALFGMTFSASNELFGVYGSDVATTMAMMPFGIGVLIGAPISGGLYDLTGDYTLSLLVILAIFTCSAVLLLIIPIRRRIRSMCYSARSNQEIPDMSSAYNLAYVNST